MNAWKKIVNYDLSNSQRHKQMTRLFGFTTILQTQHVVGLGCRCFVWCIYLARVPRRRLKGYCYMTTSENVVFHMKHNSGGKFRFLGYTSIDEDDLRDE